jgi:hypothetical protein
MRARLIAALLVVECACAAQPAPCPRTSAPSPAPAPTPSSSSPSPAAASASVPVPSTAQTPRIHDVGLLASNVAELREFYSKLGFQLAFSDGDKLVVFVLGSNEFAIHTSSQRPTVALGISVVVDDLSQMESKLKGLGIAYDGPKEMRPGLIGVGIRDPNGNRVEFLHAK